MDTLLIISLLMAIGFLLVIVEIFFIPGTTLVGILGLIFSGAAIVMTYLAYGNQIGLYVLVSTSALKLGLLIYTFRAQPWLRFSHKNAITSKVNEGLNRLVEINMIGKTVSTLRPVGKARFNDQEFEVKTLSKYISEGVNIRVVQIVSNQIIVEPTN